MMWTPAHFTDQEADYRLHLTWPQLVLSGLVLQVYRKKYYFEFSSEWKPEFLVTFDVHENLESEQMQGSDDGISIYIKTLRNFNT